MADRAYVQISVPPRDAMPCLHSTMSVSLIKPWQKRWATFPVSPSLSGFLWFCEKNTHERVQRVNLYLPVCVLCTAISRWMENLVSARANVRSLFTLKSHSNRSPWASMCYQYSHSLYDAELLKTADGIKINVRGWFLKLINVTFRGPSDCLIHYMCNSNDNNNCKINISSYCN